MLPTIVVVYNRSYAILYTYGENTMLKARSAYTAAQDDEEEVIVECGEVVKQIP